MALTVYTTSNSISKTIGIVDFGHASGGESDQAETIISAPQVTANSIITCDPFRGSAYDHDGDDISIEGITVQITDVIPGVGFSIMAEAANMTWGRYQVNCKIQG